jgi:hypothetical protein
MNMDCFKKKKQKVRGEKEKKGGKGRPSNYLAQGLRWEG